MACDGNSTLRPAGRLLRGPPRRGGRPPDEAWRARSINARMRQQLSRPDGATAVS